MNKKKEKITLNRLAEKVGEGFKQVNKRFDQVDKRFGQVDKRFDQVDERFGQVDKRFGQVDKRFGQVDKRFEQVNKRFGQMDKRFEQVDGRIERVDKRFGQVDKRFESTEERINNNTNEKFENFAIMVQKGFVDVENRLGSRIDAIGRRTNKLENNIEKNHLEMKEGFDRMDNRFRELREEIGETNKSLGKLEKTTFEDVDALASDIIELRKK